MVAQSSVIHQQTNSVGLSCAKLCKGGGEEYRAIFASVNHFRYIRL